MKVLGGFLFIAGLTGTAHAGTTLVTIPIADILRHREVSILHTIQTAEHTKDQYFHYTNVTLGLKDRIEIGAATDYAGNDSVDFKVLLTEGRNGAVSAGAMNIRERNFDWFAVGRWDMEATRLHGGVMRVNGAAQLILGVDHDLGKYGSLMADFTSGSDSSFWTGWGLEAAPGVFLMAAYGNYRQSPASFYLNATITLRF